MINNWRPAGLGRRLRRLLIPLVAIGLAVPVAVVAAPAPVQAQQVSVQALRDGFEDAVTPWRFPIGDAGIERNSPNPRSGQNNGYMFAGLSHAVRPVRLPLTDASCSASFFVQTPGMPEVIIGITNAQTGQWINAKPAPVENTGGRYVRGPIVGWSTHDVVEIEVHIYAVGLVTDEQPRWLRMDDLIIDCFKEFP